MTSQAGSIFLTWENLAFAMPLILLCSFYAYFKYVPLEYGLPILGVLAVIMLIRAQIQKLKNKKLEKLDEDMVRELVGEDDSDDIKKEAEAKKSRQAKARLEQRLAAERKSAAKSQQGKKGKKKKGKDDDDDEDLSAFAKKKK
mmetsp:Transcript_17897/g.26541  ORF Transcript_17897/g.26541 Transcript_17897/m.26541 type:complete len:143 (-) Transcript_17897:268-696(-)